MLSFLELLLLLDSLELELLLLPLDSLELLIIPFMLIIPFFIPFDFRVRRCSFALVASSLLLPPVTNRRSNTTVRALAYTVMMMVALVQVKTRRV
jgi:hypothetical protein